MRPFVATRVDLDRIILSEVSKRQISYRLSVESKTMIQMHLFTKQKLAHRHRKQTYGYQRGKMGKRYTGNLGLIDAYYYI